MNPIATTLFLAGYGLALPIGSRLRAVVAEQHRLAMVGHQVGVLIATLGWVVRGRLLLAFVHLVWLTAAATWFAVSPRLPSRRARGAPEGP